MNKVKRLRIKQQKGKRVKRQRDIKGTQINFAILPFCGFTILQFCYLAILLFCLFTKKEPTPKHRFFLHIVCVFLSRL
ncbi:hypothetical protein HMPREF0204_12634 [Chryseobacterium gleum ATCC 35910]|uniref:Uncharacterized protein n=1 Tax=Chryseobacterium gleum ATCC 35910 TaxID=525257 RepID=A0ABN0AKX7_CHRGE|nr:hypothetical protein HMPREF0204_12634 [Chryseobacterium gleum ATCC 35910]